ncbi:MAG: divergent polysaccharide deacetylase family protein [Abyssibacter sp.]|uniref:divergent polysaccharide deacetylase family protein n=1 Tax=Abyssibacter sp. TaxID=2320200 RepID=UPI002EAFF80C|nr:divergent polysaccharide deacetylase family protein [Pseudomonadota bacterium]
MKGFGDITAWGLGCLLIVASAAAQARPQIAIIIDDLGYGQRSGQRVLDLPGPVACAFIPDAPHSPIQARQAHAAGKEVMLHLPMEPHSGARAHPTTLTTHSTANDVQQMLHTAMRDIPHVVGVNNHQGSLLTEQTTHMRWLMDAMDAYPHLYFVDSMTTPRSVALRSARAALIPSTRRNVFLDHVRSRPAIEAEFDRLVRLAERHGTALAIGHPYSETLAVLEARLPELASRGIDLVPVGSLIQLRTAQRSDQTWRVSLRLGGEPKATMPFRTLRAAN